MKIEKIAIDKLLLDPANARKHGQKNLDSIKGSLAKFGQQKPIVVNADNVIVAGNGTMQAAKELGWKEINIVRTDLKGSDITAFGIADNRTSELAEWDDKVLQELLEGLKAEDFDLSAIGFDIDDINEMIGDKNNAGLTDPDEVPEPPKVPITKLGDIWQLGNNRLMCGDSTSIDAVEKLMPEKANMTFTDPPYLMNFTGGIHADGSKSFNAKHGAIKNDKMSESEGNDFLDAINSIIYQKVDGAFYITFYRLGIDKYYASMERTGLKCRSLIIWDKGNHTLSNSDYMSMYEPMFYGWVNNHKFYGGKNGMDIWRISRTKKNDLHPTMKPVELVEKAILDGSQVNGIVLDLFGGSGTTLIACEKTGRHARLMELDPKYCDVIIQRYIAFKGTSDDVYRINADGTKTKYEDIT